MSLTSICTTRLVLRLIGWFVVGLSKRNWVTPRTHGGSNRNEFDALSHGPLDLPDVIVGTWALPVEPSGTRFHRRSSRSRRRILVWQKHEDKRGQDFTARGSEELPFLPSFSVSPGVLFRHETLRALARDNPQPVCLYDRPRKNEGNRVFWVGHGTSEVASGTHKPYPFLAEEVVNSRVYRNSTLFSVSLQGTRGTVSNRVQILKAKGGPRPKDRELRNRNRVTFPCQEQYTIKV